MSEQNYISIGSAPYDEHCEQAGSNYSRVQAIKECRALIAQIRRIIGPEPAGARLAVKRFDHDFGGYHEVVCHYAVSDEAAREYAFKAEASLPEKWDEQARKDLGL